MEALGWIGSWLLALCGAPTAIRCWQEGHSRGLSAAFIFMCFMGELLTMVYVWPKHDWPLILNYVLNLVFVGIMAYYKVRPRR